MNINKSIIKGLNEAIKYEKDELNARKHKYSINPIRIYNAAEIKHIRNSLSLTQPLFASLLGVSKKTVEAWEAGNNTPNGSACRLLNMLQADPDLPKKYNIFTTD